MTTEMVVDGTLVMTFPATSFTGWAASRLTEYVPSAVAPDTVISYDDADPDGVTLPNDTPVPPALKVSWDAENDCTASLNTNVNVLVLDREVVDVNDEVMLVTVGGAVSNPTYQQTPSYVQHRLSHQ